MALIQKIRNNSWLLIVLLGLAMAAFLLMDMFSGNNGMIGGPSTTVGKIGNRNVSYQEFEAKNRFRFGNSAGNVFAQRNAIWDMFVEESIVQDEADALGLSVSKDELSELLWGPNYSPIIIRDFPNQNFRGQVNAEQINQIKSSIESGQMNKEFASFWMQEEKDVINDRLKSKMVNLTSKAFYTPTWMVEMSNDEKNTRGDIEVVKIPFDAIEDTQVELTDNDYSSYLSANSAKYVTKNPTFGVNYVAFDVLPSQEDSTALRTELSELVSGFSTAESDSSFVLRNKGAIDVTYFRKDELSEAVKDRLFEEPVGSVVGPYVDGRFYKLAKILNRKVTPDSVQARHILVSTQANNPFSVQTAKNKIDSLKSLILAGTHQFDSLAIKHSDDPGSGSKGGDLGMVGYPSNYVKPFKDAVFFGAGRGKLQVVQSQFGIHLIEVTKTKSSGTQGVQVAYIERPIKPSQATVDKIYQEASQFAGDNRSLENLEKAAVDKGLTVETALNLEENSYNIPGLSVTGNASRDIIRWANNDANIGEVSPKVYAFKDNTFYYDNKFVVPALASRTKAGLPSIASVKSAIEPLVRNQKKAEMLKAKISSTDLSAIATQFSTKVDTIKGLTFNSPMINDDREADVIAAALALDVDQVSNPIVGNNGVYMVKLSNRIAARAPSNISQLRKEASSKYQSAVKNGLIRSIKEVTNIEDNRNTFF